VDYDLSLAEPPEWSADGLSVTVTLKPWKWSNGETVTAQDVVFWIHMMQAEASTNWGAFVPGGFPTNVSNVKATSSTTLTMTMNKPYSPTWFLYNNLSQITPMPAAWDRTASGPSSCATTVSDCAAVYNYLSSQAKDQSSYATSPIWSIVDGPWKLSAFNADGHVTFVPNKSYSGPVKPHLAAFQEVPFAVGQPQRPRLGDAEVQQGDGPQVAAQCDIGVGPAGHRRRQCADLLEHAVEMAAQPRQQQVQRGDRRPQPVVRGGVRPRDLQVRRRLREAHLVEIGDRVDQGQLRGLRAGRGREGAQQCRHGSRLAVQGHAERVVGEQAGRLGPLASGLQVPDGVGGLRVVGEPPRGEPVQRRNLGGLGAAQHQPEQPGEEMVVTEPGAVRVE